MRPQWFPNESIPFEEMWVDDKYWFPHMLRNEDFTGYFLFEGESQVVSHVLTEGIQPLQGLVERPAAGDN